MPGADHRQQALIAGRARRIGWNVETGDGSQWLYRITRPDGRRVQLHQSPSDVNWQKAVLRQLNGADRLFDQAETARKAQQEARREDKLAADKVAGDAAIAKAETKAARVSRALTRAAGPYAVTDADPQWLLTPHALPEMKQVILGPDLAGKILDNANGSNRRLREYRVQEFTQIIKDGEWAVTHQGIAIDRTGTLQDGQHRLAAIVATGMPQQILVSVGMPPENFTKIDSPLLRTARDALGMRGEHNVSLLTSTARLVIGFDRYGGELAQRKGQMKLSIDTVDRFVAEHAEQLRAAVDRCVVIRREIKIVGSALATAVYLIGRAVGEDNPRVTRFFDDIETGIGVDKADAVYVLRRQFIRRENERGRPSQYLALALIIKAWNRRVAKRPGGYLAWRTDEWFPATIMIPPPEDTNDDN